MRQRVTHDTIGEFPRHAGAERKAVNNSSLRAGPMVRAPHRECDPMSDFADSYLKPAYSPTEAERLLGRKAVRKAIGDRILIPRQIGTRSFILADDLLAWARSFPPTPKQPRQTRSTS